MATLALPIRELELSVRVDADKARAETECVVFYSQARRTSPSFAMTFKLALAIAFLKFMLRSLAQHQKKLIRAYQETDFTRFSNEDLLSICESLEKIVEQARPVLSRLADLGPRGQSWLGTTLPQLEEQVGHLYSISQSLRVATDPEASVLMAVAVQHMAARA